MNVCDTVIVESFQFYIILSIIFSIRLMKGKFGRLSFSLHQIIDSFSPIVRVRTKLKRK